MILSLPSNSISRSSLVVRFMVCHDLLQQKCAVCVSDMLKAYCKMYTTPSLLMNNDLLSP